MASTLKKAPLEVSVTETYSLNGRNHVVKNSTTYKDIRETTTKITTCAAGAGTTTTILDLVNDYTKADIRYIRITNLDDGQTGIGGANAFSGTVQVRINSTAPAVIQNVWLTAGSSFTLTDVSSPAEVLGTISIVNDTGVDADAIAVDIEVFVASV
jgi:hypothetical protein